MDFAISSKAFYQVNSLQTEKLYSLAAEFAELTGKETVIDAYCGIGTIGLSVSNKCKSVLGIEINRDSVRNANDNAKRNNVTNASFICGDAGAVMKDLARKGQSADVVFMDPPREGSTVDFMRSMVSFSPKKIVYISCNPETQARDLKYLVKQGYKVKRISAVDMFPHTEHVESVVCLERR
jgi:23S rRNA (uracil1939-C5)-methyltransferase